MSREPSISKEQIILLWERHWFYTHTLPHFQPHSKYPAVSSERERSRYAAVFQDQYAEFLELQQEVGSAQAKLQQLEALLTSLPPPRSQVSNQVETPTPESFQVARPWPSPHLLGPDLRLLPTPGWAGTTDYGQASALEVLPRLATLPEPQFPHPSLGPALPESSSSFCRRRLKLLAVSGGNLRRSRR